MRRAGLALFAALFVNCATASPPVALALEHLPAVAAQYRTTFQPADEKSPERTIAWRFWRETDRLASENLTEHSGLRWQRDGSALFAQVLLHDQRRTLDYQPDDWAMVGVQPSWAEQCLLIDPAVLSKLEPRPTASDRGHPVQRFVGVIGTAHWDVSLRADLALPLEISKRTPAGWEHTLLTEVHELQEAPWQPPLTTGYRIVEIADLGDAPSEDWLEPPTNSTK